MGRLKHSSQVSARGDEVRSISIFRILASYKIRIPFLAYKVRVVFIPLEGCIL